MLAGAFFIAAGFILIGPAPFIPLETTLPLATIGLVTVGVGIGAGLVSGFMSAFQEATLHGFPNNLSTYGLVRDCGLRRSPWELSWDRQWPVFY